MKATLKRILCKWIYPPLEARLFARAKGIILNTPSMHKAYSSLYRDAADRSHHIPNGFDEDFFAGTGRVPERKRPLLLYCGRFAGIAGRSPEVLLQAMRLAIDAGIAVDLEILGDDSEFVRRAVQRHGLRDHVKSRPPVSGREAARAMGEADVLALYQAPGHGPVTPIAGKTFEYLRAGRPILAIVPAGNNADLVRRYAGTSAVVSGENPRDVATAIARLLEEPKPTQVNGEFAETFNRRRIAAQVARVFDGVCLPS